MKYSATINSAKSAEATHKTPCPVPFPPLLPPHSVLQGTKTCHCIVYMRNLSLDPATVQNSCTLLSTKKLKLAGSKLCDPVLPLRGGRRLEQAANPNPPARSRRLRGSVVKLLLIHYCQWQHPIQLITRIKDFSKFESQMCKGKGQCPSAANWLAGGIRETLMPAVG